MRMVKWMVPVMLLALAGCDGAKKAEEAKKAAEAQAAAAAASAKAAAEAAAAKAKEEAQKVFDGQKSELSKKLTEGVEALDRKVAFLKEKAAKLPPAAKKKAEAALAAYDTAKAAVVALQAQIDSAVDAAGLTGVADKLTAALADAGKALDGAEAAIMPAKK